MSDRNISDLERLSHPQLVQKCMEYMKACDRWAEMLNTRHDDIAADRDRLRAEVEETQKRVDSLFGTLQLSADWETIAKQWKAKAERYEQALEKIKTSAPCKKDHMSFNSPNQECDQRIAARALIDGNSSTVK